MSQCRPIILVGLVAGVGQWLRHLTLHTKLACRAGDKSGPITALKCLPGPNPRWSTLLTSCTPLVGHFPMLEPSITPMSPPTPHRQLDSPNIGTPGLPSLTVWLPYACRLGLVTQLNNVELTNMSTANLPLALPHRLFVSLMHAGWTL